MQKILNYSIKLGRKYVKLNKTLKIKIKKYPNKSNLKHNKQEHFKNRKTI